MLTLKISMLSLLLVAGAASATKPSLSPAALPQPSQVQVQTLPGSYRLSDGRTLRITESDGKLNAELQKHKLLTLVGAAPNQLASTDGTVLIIYDPADPVTSLKLSD